MKKMLTTVCLLLLISSAVCASAADRETIYQGSTMEALLAGNFDGVASVKKIKAQGDTGLGTFAGLDGEMIVVDGKVYKAAGNGRVTVEGDEVQSPFYAVTYFDADIAKKIAAADMNLDLLRKELDKLRPRDDLAYAIIIKGKFKAVKLRSVGPYHKPFPQLSEALKEQSVFEHAEVSGRLVGFWLPAFLGNTNAAGYHLHFLSDDRQKGGHVLDLIVTEAEITLDETANLHVEFSPYPAKPLERADRYQP